MPPATSRMTRPETLSVLGGVQGPYICMCIYVYMYVYPSVYLSIYMYKSIHVYIYIYVYVFTYIYICIDTSTVLSILTIIVTITTILISPFISDHGPPGRDYGHPAEVLAPKRVEGRIRTKIRPRRLAGTIVLLGAPKDHINIRILQTM